MPFEQTQVKPIVADLLKVRAWIAEHGFSTRICENERGCFVYAAMKSLGSTGWQFRSCTTTIEQELIREFGEPLAGDNDNDDGESIIIPTVFSVLYLSRNVGTTERAIEIIDATIAREMGAA